MGEGRIIKKLLEHDEQFSNIRNEIKELRGEILQGQDEMMTILRHLDQERIFTTEWVKRRLTRLHPFSPHPSFRKSKASQLCD